MLPDLKKEGYHYIIDLHHNLRTFLVKTSLFAVKSSSFNKLNFQKWLYVNFKINRLPNKHIVDRYLETVAFLGVENDGKGLDFFIPENLSNASIEPSISAKNNPISLLLAQLPNNFIAFPIGAGRQTKALTIDKIIAICDALPLPIILMGGQPEISKSQEIINRLKSDTLLRVQNFVGKGNLIEAGQILQGAHVVIAGDTGLMHIAAALNKRIISVWGNTVPEFGMYPYYPKNINLNISIEVKNLDCRPCSKIGFDACPKGHFNCIKQIDIQEIIRRVLS